MYSPLVVVLAAPPRAAASADATDASGVPWREMDEKCALLDKKCALLVTLPPYDEWVGDVAGVDAGVPREDCSCEDLGDDRHNSSFSFTSRVFCLISAKLGRPVGEAR